MLRVELKRAFYGRPFWIALLIAFGSLAFGVYDYASFLIARPETISLAPSFFYNAYDAVVWSQNRLIGLIAPIIAVLPFADTFALDRKSGYIRSILIRASYRHYLTAKWITCLLSGGLVLMIPLLALFGVTSLIFPHGLNLIYGTQKIMTRADALGPWGFLYETNPTLYIFALSTMCFVFGATYAGMGLAIATMTVNRYVILATPLVFYYLANFMLALLGYSQWLLYVPIVPQAVMGVTAVHVATSLVSIFGVSLILFITLTARARVGI
jgi:hypothetical protein